MGYKGGIPGEHGGARQNGESILHFTKGTLYFSSHHYNPPKMGYHWVRGDPRITPRWAPGTGTERFRFQNRKTVPPLIHFFKGQIRIKQHLNVQNEVSHDRNRSGTEPEPIWNRSVPDRFQSCDASICTFKHCLNRI